MKRILLILILLPCILCADLYKIQKLTYVGLQLSDTVTTLYGINHGAIEKNGTANDIIDFSPILFVGTKVVYTYGSLWVFDKLYDRSPILANLSLFILNSVYASVQYKNIGICFSIPIK